MAEYIPKDKAVEACFDGWNNNAHDCAENIRSIPAADVRPVVRGKWKYNPGDNIPYCSECMMPQDSECNFCPNCGARMEES